MSTATPAEEPIDNSDQARYRRLFMSPDLLPWQIDTSADRLLLALIDEPRYRNASFLDQRLNADGRLQAFWVPLERIGADYHSAPRESVGCEFIFHIGHCGSTLLSRLLGDHRRLLPLREPLVLRTLAETERRIASGGALPTPASWQELLTLLVGLLTRTYALDQRALIKASSNCNNLIRPLVESHPEHRALLLYLNFESYLASVLRPQSRAALDTFLEARLFDLRHLTSLVIPESGALSPAQRGAINWCASMVQFMAARADPGLLARVRLLEFEAFLEAPARNLVELFAFFNIPVAPSAADGIVNKGYLSTYAKNPRIAYTPEMRAQDLATSRQTHAREINAAQNWLRVLLDQDPNLRGLQELLVASS